MNTRSLGTMRDEPVNRLCIYIGTCYCHGSHLGSHSRSIAASFVSVSYMAIRTSGAVYFVSSLPNSSSSDPSSDFPGVPGVQFYSNIEPYAANKHFFRRTTTLTFPSVFWPVILHGCSVSYFSLKACFLSLILAYILADYFFFSRVRKKRPTSYCRARAGYFPIG